MNDQLYQAAASKLIAAGGIPFPTDSVIEILKQLITVDQATFIQLFDRPLNRDEIKDKSGLDETGLDRMLDDLMDNGVVFGMPGRSTGIMVYRLLPPLPGIFESTMMRGEHGEKQKKLAILFENLFKSLSALVQENYDTVAPALKNIPAMTRILPVEKQIDRKFDTVLPCEDVKKLVDRFNTIAVAYCYCRHQKDLLERPCKVTDDRKNCLLFGKTAQFYIDHHFAEPITQNQARGILEKAEADGLVHKAFHEKYDIGKDEMAICNCCKCCCETFQSYYRGSSPTVTYTAYIAGIADAACSGCGVCADICPMEAIEMIDGIARIDTLKCIGCGLCAYHCTTGALALERTGQREVFVPPPRL